MNLERWNDNKTDIEWHGLALEESYYAFGYGSLSEAKYAIEKGFAIELNPFARGWIKVIC